ncbi:MAG TPA: polysaccharide biosynthesis C-terminal domain-containing protein, partial [Candidatus Thermoplasmatota archaeon]|nr:polysaccharide biosynthesis C-terminal domain-containing protein [Candidatus Thermoplasmatota archaeon]
GLYAAALKLNEILMLLPNGVAIALLPAVARLDRGGESTRLHDLMVQTERWVSMLLWPAVVLVALQPQAVIRILLSNAFLAASPILIILALQALISSLRIPLQTKALGLGQHKVAARVAVTALAVDLVLAVLLIPERIGPVPLAALGAKGAALAALAAAAFTLIAYRVQAKEWTGHPYFSRHLLRHAVAGISTYVACRLVLPYMGLMPAARFWELMLVGIVVLGVYIGYIALTGEVRKGEIRAIFRAVVKRRRPA